MKSSENRQQTDIIRADHVSYDYIKTDEEGKPESGEAGEMPGAPPEAADPLSELRGESFFFLRFNSENRLIDRDLEHIAGMDEASASELADEVRATGKGSGRVSGYSFRISEDIEEGGFAVAFLDNRGQQRSLARVLVLTLIVGCICWIAMLVFMYFLSRKAIRPIAENIRRQKQFVTDAGHEIKTPLAIIRANADVLELHLGSNKWIDNIRSQTDRLNSLTADMLMLAKMDEGRDSGVPAEEFDAGEVLGDVLRTFRESAEVRGVRITRKDDGDCRIRYRRDAYIRLLSILFENAVKYVRENGFIEAGAMREGRRITVFVRNDCDALPDCPPERLFDRFFRADQSRTRATGGSGIGLSSAKAIAEQGGGTLTAGYEDGNVIVFRLNIKSVT